MDVTLSTTEIIEQFAALFPFELDPFQLDAIRLFLEGDSVMVAAPTGTGKTIVAEFGVYEAYRAEKEEKARHQEASRSS